ncbi:very short patch repair endonuclease [Hephaestia sp. GCM10023244]|uniref:very short patch repair endonuclease n=1 Tax=unclassified Hephaestia TaxID=2631281 RepID=UPI0020773E9D|nr:very short patch repair endonuclease [Hephaestia sp. MAHUQ-44]MCM8731574.1 very short patch repair endonuclease [Hephaestia sp. MAHUQ-44]
MDKISPERRSENMRRIGRKDTAPEMVVRRTAHSLGLRYRLHRKDLPGTPDLVFPRQRLAIFVHGCFWHRHTGCRNCTTPSTRQEFWIAKFAANVERDARSERELCELGWQVEVIWECETRDRQALAGRLRSILGGIRTQ